MGESIPGKSLVNLRHGVDEAAGAGSSMPSISTKQMVSNYWWSAEVV